jgi:hypothetical protein
MSNKPAMKTFMELAPGDVVKYLGAQWKVTGYLPPYAGMAGRELRSQGRNEIVTKWHEAEEISTTFEMVAA